jgi:hypothetical protein
MHLYYYKHYSSMFYIAVSFDTYSFDWLCSKHYDVHQPTRHQGILEKVVHLVLHTYKQANVKDIQ